jgi:SulP family sulfate permease
VAETKARSLGPDLGSGLTVALVSIPEGMAYALVAGVNPVYGLYTGMLTTIVASLTGSTSLLIVTLTNALALVAGDQLAGLDTDDPIRALATLTFLVGIMMTLLGALRMGSMIRFVSREVMAGFIFVTALLIVLGQLKDLVGYHPEGTHGKVSQAIAILSNPSAWSNSTTILGLAGIAFLVAVKATRFKRFADVLVIVFTTVAVAFLGLAGIELVGDIADVPRGLDALPSFVLPDFTLIPALLAGAFAATVVGLSESSGVGAAYPNPNGKKSDMSKDFLGQGLGNLAGSFFQAMPAGGSLSRTGINASGGAQTRMSGVFSGLLLAIVLVLFGSSAELIPLAGLAALLIVIGAEIMLKEGRVLMRAWKTSRYNTFIAVATIILGVSHDLTVAIFGGVILSLIAFAVNASDRVTCFELERAPDGNWVERPTPEALPPNETTILEIRGPLNFASVYSFAELFPDPKGAHGATLILSCQDQELQSLTSVDWVENFLADLSSAEARLILAEVGPALLADLEKSGLLEKLGAHNIFPASDVKLASLNAAYAAVQSQDAE